MAFLDGLTNIVGGGLFKEVKDVVMAYFPPDMPPEKKAELQFKLDMLDAQKTKDLNNAIADSEKSLNDRVAIYEGTASDLKTIPYLGAVMLFLRGGQRIIFGYGTIYLDFMVFSKHWPVEDETLKSAFWIVNLLVLGFLFGERAVKNVMPLIIEMVKNSKFGK